MARWQVFSRVSSLSISNCGDWKEEEGGRRRKKDSVLNAPRVPHTRAPEGSASLRGGGASLRGAPALRFAPK